VGNMNSNLSPL